MSYSQHIQNDSAIQTSISFLVEPDVLHGTWNMETGCFAYPNAQFYICQILELLDRIVSERIACRTDTIS